MKLQLSDPGGLNQITGYGADFVSVNGVRHTRSLLIMSHQLVPDWPAASAQALTPEHLHATLEHQPEVVLLGTGARLRFPQPEVLRPLIDAKVGYEIMDTGAACRTYNILMAEGRRVLAALIIA